MRSAAIALTLLLASTGVKAETPISPEQIISAIDRLQDAGAPPSTSRHFTISLIDWLHAAGADNGTALAQANTAVASMIAGGVITTPGMEELCQVAPRCFEHLASGGGLTIEETRRHANDRDWVALNALGKMFAVARNHYVAKGGNGGRRVSEAQVTVELTPIDM